LVRSQKWLRKSSEPFFDKPRGGVALDILFRILREVHFLACRKIREEKIIEKEISEFF
jgi:hypothetical protein